MELTGKFLIDRVKALDPFIKSISILECTFFECTGNEIGTAIYVQYISASLMVDRSLFINCSAMSRHLISYNVDDGDFCIQNTCFNNGNILNGGNIIVYNNVLISLNGTSCINAQVTQGLFKFDYQFIDNQCYFSVNLSNIKSMSNPCFSFPAGTEKYFFINDYESSDYFIMSSNYIKFETSSIANFQAMQGILKGCKKMSFRDCTFENVNLKLLIETSFNGCSYKDCDNFIKNNNYFILNESFYEVTEIVPIKVPFHEECISFVQKCVEYSGSFSQILLIKTQVSCIHVMNSIFSDITISDISMHGIISAYNSTMIVQNSLFRHISLYLGSGVIVQRYQPDHSNVTVKKTCFDEIMAQDHILIRSVSDLYMEKVNTIKCDSFMTSGKPSYMFESEDNDLVIRQTNISKCGRKRFGLCIGITNKMLMERSIISESNISYIGVQYDKNLQLNIIESRISLMKNSSLMFEKGLTSIRRSIIVGDVLMNCDTVEIVECLIEGIICINSSNTIGFDEGETRKMNIGDLDHIIVKVTCVGEMDESKISLALVYGLVAAGIVLIVFIVLTSVFMIRRRQKLIEQRQELTMLVIGDFG